jgi:Transglycosylase SLT domain
VVRRVRLGAVGRTLSALAWLWLTGAVQASEAGRAAGDPDCRAAAVASEQAVGLPRGLLLAIGQVESGRFNPATGRIDPWPWTTNSAGEGHYFASSQDAQTWVAAERGLGRTSIDVGCFQVNLEYHPDAFASMPDAFEPASNARYAAVLLNQLHDRTGDWPAAVALYHSADPAIGFPYSGRVLAAWKNDGRPAGEGPITLPRLADVVVLRLASGAASVRVIVPAWAMTQGTAATPASPKNLPRVYIPIAMREYLAISRWSGSP